MTYSLKAGLAANVSVLPEFIFLSTATDNLNTITTAGYIKPDPAITPTSVIFATYAGNNFGIFTPTFNNGVITLESALSDVITPTVVNNIAVFANTQGTIKDSGALTASALNLSAGYNGTQGTVYAWPSGSNMGNFAMTGTNNSGGNFTNYLTNGVTAQSTTYSFPDPGQATANVATSIGNGTLVYGNTLNNSNAMVVVNVALPFSSLGSGGRITLLASAASHQYQILNIFLNGLSGTAYSGGGGNRNLSITDGTTTWSVIPAATLQTPTNSVWGSTAVAAPTGSTGFNAASVAGSRIYAAYSGGTTDYTAGNLMVTIVAIQVA